MGDPLTREQFAAIMARALGADLSAVDESVLGSFSDGNETSGWAASAMSCAVETGILRGSETADGSMELRPGADILRGEMAVMIKRAVDSGMLPIA